MEKDDNEDVVVDIEHMDIEESYVMLELALDLSKTIKQLTEKRTDEFIDNALIRHCTYLSLRPGVDEDSAEFKNEEYGLIREAFHDDYGDRALSLIIFQYHKMKVLRDALEQRQLNVGNPNIKKMSTLEDEVLAEGDDISDSEIEGLDELRKASQAYRGPVTEDTQLGELYSLDGINEIIQSAIIKNREIRDRWKAKYVAEMKKPEDQRDTKKTDEYYSRTQGYEIFASALEAGIHEHKLTPYWGRAIRFLENIDFKEIIKKGISKEKRDAIHVALELYGISGIDLEMIANEFDSLKNMYDDDFITRDEERNLSAQSRNATKIMSYFFSVDERMAEYLLNDLFYVPKELNGSCLKNLRTNAQEVSTYVRSGRLSERHFLDAERSRLNLKTLKNKSDQYKMDIVDEVERFMGLTEFAYLDEVHSQEEIDILKFLGKTKYYLVGDRDIDIVLKGSQRHNILLLTNDLTMEPAINMIMGNSPYQVLVTDDFTEGDKYVREHKPDFILVQDGYTFERSPTDEIIDFMKDGTKGNYQPEIIKIPSGYRGKTILTELYPKMIRAAKKAE